MPVAPSWLDSWASHGSPVECAPQQARSLSTSFLEMRLAVSWSPYGKRFKFHHNYDTVRSRSISEASRAGKTISRAALRAREPNERSNSARGQNKTDWTGQTGPVKVARTGEEEEGKGEDEGRRECSPDSRAEEPYAPGESRPVVDDLRHPPPRLRDNGMLEWWLVV